ncbi:MAG: hemin receptor [Corynebacterium sp.]|nr:hemin receptor [Corynebacterium sp.]
MNYDPFSTFSSIYPDVDPTQGLPLTPSERGGLAIACAIAIFGAISEDYVIALVGFALVLCASIFPARKTPRRIRNEARERFPNIGWAEDAHEDKARILFPAFWIIIAGACIALSLIPATRGNTTVAGVAAAITTVLVWFLPGTSRIWSS